MSGTESPDFDRMAYDRKILKETMLDREEIKQLRSEIERIRLDAPAHANVVLSEENDALIEQNARLLAALRSVDCPGGGWNGMPEGFEATVGACVDRDQCGCSLGDAVRQAKGKNP